MLAYIAYSNGEKQRKAYVNINNLKQISANKYILKRDDGHYYEAIILLTSDSRESLEKQIAKRKPRIPRNVFREFPTMSTESHYTNTQNDDQEHIIKRWKKRFTNSANTKFGHNNSAPDLLENNESGENLSEQPDNDVVKNTQICQDKNDIHDNTVSQSAKNVTHVSSTESLSNVLSEQDAVIPNVSIDETSKQNKITTELPTSSTNITEENSLCKDVYESILPDNKNRKYRKRKPIEYDIDTDVSSISSENWNDSNDEEFTYSKNDRVNYEPAKSIKKSITGKQLTKRKSKQNLPSEANRSGILRNQHDATSGTSKTISRKINNASANYKPFVKDKSCENTNRPPNDLEVLLRLLPSKLINENITMDEVNERLFGKKFDNVMPLSEDEREPPETNHKESGRKRQHSHDRDSIESHDYVYSENEKSKKRKNKHIQDGTSHYNYNKRNIRLSPPKDQYIQLSLTEVYKPILYTSELKEIIEGIDKSEKFPFHIFKYITSASKQLITNVDYKICNRNESPMSEYKFTAPDHEIKRLNAKVDTLMLQLPLLMDKFDKKFSKHFQNLYKSTSMTASMSIEVLRDQIHDMLPAQSLSDFLKFEELLSVSLDVRAILKDEFRTVTIKETTMRNFARKIMTYTLGKDVEREYSGTGKKFRDISKLSFKTTQTYRCMEAVAKEKFGVTPELESLSSIVGQWLAETNDRYGGRKRRLEKLNE